MKKHSPPPSVDREIEARVVALVLGEASDFEREELERLISERPELAAFRDEIAGVDDLMREVGSGDWPSKMELADGDSAESDWKLPSEKRRAIEAALRGDPVIDTSRNGLHAAKDSLPWSFLLTKYTLGVAASILLMGFIGVWALMNGLSAVRKSSVATTLSEPSSRRFEEVASARAGALAEATDDEHSPPLLSKDPYSWSRASGGESDAAPRSVAKSAKTEGESIAAKGESIAAEGNVYYDSIAPADSNMSVDSDMDGAQENIQRFSESSLAELQEGLDFSVQAPDSNGNSGQQASSPRSTRSSRGTVGAQSSSGSLPSPGGLESFGRSELSMPFGANEKFNAPTPNMPARPATGGRIMLGGAVNGGMDASGMKGINVGGEYGGGMGGGSGDSGGYGDAAGFAGGGGMGGFGGGMGGGGGFGGGGGGMGAPPSPSQPSAPSSGLGMNMGEAAGMSMDTPAIVMSQREEARLAAPAFATPPVEALADKEAADKEPVDEDAMLDLFDSAVNSPAPATPVPEPASAPAPSPAPVTASAMPPTADDALKTFERSRDTAHTADVEVKELEALFGGVAETQRKSVLDLAKQEAKKKSKGQSTSQQTQAQTRGVPIGGQVAGGKAAGTAGSGAEAITGAAPKFSSANNWSSLQMPTLEFDNGRRSQLKSIDEVTVDEMADSSDFGLQLSENELESKIAKLQSSAADLSRELGDDFADGEIVRSTNPAESADTTLADGSISTRADQGGWRYRASGENNDRYAKDFLGDKQSLRGKEKLPMRYRNGLQEYYKQIDGKGDKTSEVHWGYPDEKNIQLGYAGKAILGRNSKGKAVVAGLDEKSAADESFSTFSLHVSDVSFKLALAALSRGEWPETAKIRIEEFVNAMDYGDPAPSHDQRVACQTEQAIHPFLQQRNLLRVSMRTAASGRASSTPLRLTFLIDNSGSMDRIDRKQIVRRAFQTLAGQLKAGDQVTLITFARQPRLLADRLDGAKAKQLVELINNLPSEGGTNIEAALTLAFEKAREQQLVGAQNRIILLTDGAVNLGDADPESLAESITAIRGAGIAFDAAGISAEGLNDEVLEALTRKGDGRYYLLDSPESADENFANQIAGAFRPAAKNVKVQVEFNPGRVGQYKLLGFEKHRLKKEDFRNDKVDAAEMAAAEAGVAVYQFEAKPDGEGDVGTVSVRFRDLSSGRMVEQTWPIPYLANAPRADQTEVSMRLATAAAMLAAKLRGEALGQSVDLKALSNLIATLPEQVRKVETVAQLQFMIQQARQLEP